MEPIIVHTQAELDAVPLGVSIQITSDPAVVLELCSDPKTHIVITDYSRVVISGHSRVTAQDHSYVTALDYSHVTALDQSQVLAYGESLVERY